MRPSLVCRKSAVFSEKHKRFVQSGVVRANLAAYCAAPDAETLFPLPFIFWMVAVCAGFRADASVVINEILYRPGNSLPENTALEFIELYNPDTASVDLAGWGFTKGVLFTFPAGASIPGGGYVVVAANPAAVQTAYAISGVFGPWRRLARFRTRTKLSHYPSRG
jgi:hypothetical protein